MKKKVWKEVNEVIRATIEVPSDIRSFKELMEKPPKGVGIKSKSKFRKNTRVERY